MLKISSKNRKYVMAMIWMFASGSLLFRAFPFIQAVDGTGMRILFVGIGVAIGVSKGWFVIAKSVRRNLAYIDRRPEKDWFWWSVHPLLYVFIPAMIGVGVTVRVYLGETQPGIVAALYLGVALALMVGLRGMRRAAPTC